MRDRWLCNIDVAGHINKKAGSRFLVARPACRGLRIAHRSLNEQRRMPHAEYAVVRSAWVKSAVRWHRPCAKRSLTHSCRHLLCCFAVGFCCDESCEVSTRQTKRQVNAFYQYASPPAAAHRWGLRRRDGAKLAIFSHCAKFFCDNFRPRGRHDDGRIRQTAVWQHIKRNTRPAASSAGSVLLRLLGAAGRGWHGLAAWRVVSTARARWGSRRS